MDRAKRTPQQIQGPVALTLRALAFTLIVAACNRTQSVAVTGGSIGRSQAEAKETGGGVPFPPPVEAVAVFVPDKTVELAPAIGGPLQTLSVKLGDEVDEGSLLATIDSRKTQAELAEQESAILATVSECAAKRTEQEFAEKQDQRSKRALAERGVSELETERTEQEAARTAARTAQCQHDLEQRRGRMEVIRAELARSQVRAPFRGRVSALYVNVGATVQSSQPILRIIGGGPLLVRMAVPPSFPLHAGQTLCLSDGARHFPIEVLRAAPEIDEAMGLRVVEARLSSATPVLVQSMRVQLLPSCTKESRS